MVNKEIKHKLGIIVPYRDRHRQLILFKNHLTKYFKDIDINYELIIIEQDDAKTFNRGKLLNIGFKYAKKLNCDYVVFHDVDMLPENVDYSYSKMPVHLATNFICEDENFNRIIFDEYFGGVTIFPIEDFEKINGYSNEYWGWGFEDTDLLYRCRISNISLDKKDIIQNGGNTAALKFNGTDANVKAKNVIDLNEQITIFVTFCPDDIILNHELYDDTFTIFSVPKLGLRITFNSYSRYNFELKETNDNVIFINSQIKPNYKTNITVTIDPTIKEIKMYQDGIIVGTKTYEGNLYPYDFSNFAYLGSENRDNYFRGLITNLAVYKKILTKQEIKEISTNQFFSLTHSFGNYNSHYHLIQYYDAKFIKNYKMIDLSDNINPAQINNCEIVGYIFDEVKTIQIPHRKNCTFKLLPHEENGYVNSGWKEITTRYNQLRYYNEVLKNNKNIKLDGLNTCDFEEHGHSFVNNVTHVVVGI